MQRHLESTNKCYVLPFSILLLEKKITFDTVFSRFQQYCPLKVKISVLYFNQETSVEIIWILNVRLWIMFQYLCKEHIYLSFHYLFINVTCSSLFHYKYIFYTMFIVFTTGASRFKYIEGDMWVCPISCILKKRKFVSAVSEISNLIVSKW